MPPSWSDEQILALAPDAASAKAGRALAIPGSWANTGQDGQAAWGECQGSGKLPYQTITELHEPAFHCTCPSRKFPCKHGLGLLLLRAQWPARFPEASPPDWVRSWLERRTRRATAQAEKAASPAAPADPAASARRTAQRQARIEEGLADLDHWLRDLMRQGLAQAPRRDYRFWDAPAARLVDAQAPGLARWVRELATLAASGPGWQERLLDQLTRITLLREAYRRRDALAEPEFADVRALLGFTQSQDEVLRQPGMRDHWLVVARTTELEESLRVQRTWLQGTQTGRFGLVLHFAAGGAPLDTSLPPGTHIDAELAFHPSAVPLRALIRQRHATLPPPGASPGEPTILVALAACRAGLTRHPWQRLWPVAFAGVTPVADHGRWWVRDEAGDALPLHPRFAQGWTLLAVSGGHPVWLFGEWNGEHLLPLAVRHEGGLLHWEAAS